MGVFHLVMARARQEREVQVAQVLSSLATFADSLPAVRASSGPDISKEGFQQGYTHALVIEFGDEAGRDAYLRHPDHEELAGVLVTVTEQCLVLAIESGQGLVPDGIG
ncbi:Dabb family protein [Kribbella sp. NPDC050241]|uniref:Dabb family protein n=1 Tax=Kribbella sp. NPDC050241 TaxID=3364115 RepID=UPI003788B729